MGGGGGYQQMLGGIIQGLGGAGMAAGAFLHKDDGVEWMGPEIAGLTRVLLERRGDQFLEREEEIGLGSGDVGRKMTAQNLFGTRDSPGIIDTLFRTSKSLDRLSSPDAMKETGRRVSAFRQSDPILGTLSNQIQRDLGLEGELDPATRREVEQSARSGQAARGMGFGNADLFSEMMQIGSMAEQRKRERQAMAMNFLSNPISGTPQAAASTMFTPFQQFNIAQQTAGPSMLGPLGSQFGASSAAKGSFMNIGGAPTIPDPADNRWSNFLMVGGAAAMQAGASIGGSGGGGGGGGMDISSMAGGFGG